MLTSFKFCFVQTRAAYGLTPCLLYQGELLRALGSVKASASLLGVPLGHNSSFLQGPAFAPPRIREAIWCGSTNSSTEEGTIKHLIIAYMVSNYELNTLPMFEWILTRSPTREFLNEMKGG